MKPKKILVLEDDKLTRTIICEILKSVGYDVVQASTAPQAVKIAREDAPDLITLDVVLGADSPTDAMDGLKVGAWLKRLNEDRQVPMIIISSMDPKAVASGVAAAEPVTYLTKPVEKAKLLAAVADALAKAAPASTSAPAPLKLKMQ